MMLRDKGKSYCCRDRPSHITFARGDIEVVAVEDKTVKGSVVGSVQFGALRCKTQWKILSKARYDKNLATR